jgi:peroxiredoxin
LFKDAQQSRDSNGAGQRNVLEVASLEARGQLQIADGDTESGLATLKKAADLDRQRFLSGDPGAYPNVVGEAYGRACLRVRKWSEAEAAFRATLQKKPNSGIALCGLIESCLMQEKITDAAEAREKLQKVWKFADPDLPHLQRMKALGTSIQLASAEERAEMYRQLDRYGPARWEPVPAPGFALKDRDERIVRLSDYKGKNLIVIFYLGGTCQHCIQQLNSFAKDKDAFDALDTEIVAISADTPADNQSVLCEGKPFPFPLLSDPQLVARHAFKAFDDFENLELHGTYLIDKTSRVRWFTTGSTPFTDLGFLKREVGRVNRIQ